MCHLKSYHTTNILTITWFLKSRNMTLPVTPGDLLCVPFQWRHFFSPRSWLVITLLPVFVVKWAPLDTSPFLTTVYAPKVSLHLCISYPFFSIPQLLLLKNLGHLTSEFLPVWTVPGANSGCHLACSPTCCFIWNGAQRLDDSHVWSVWEESSWQTVLSWEAHEWGSLWY